MLWQLVFYEQLKQERLLKEQQEHELELERIKQRGNDEVVLLLKEIRYMISTKDKTFNRPLCKRHWLSHQELEALGVEVEYPPKT